ncbi:hypothetical protein TI39_contig307g00038 [Zymoseptoria brevis]|uniref:Uncharacterized protein n=1 Tax=Zymoseptoria brevis TaxID=1047168 RepID=A0A0F4GUN0_9PEZI|nr:hypothetical protein TI39_contig307g00038 [Zymoseptoria brevis]
MHLPPPPSPRDLLPPLLACLPTSFVSPRPPPALLPLLSPLLRQRVNFLTTSGNDGWLPLLSWDPQRASRLPEVIQKMDLEPHPVSGELELEDPRPARYKRLDEETLQCRIEVEQFGLLPVYVYCEKDEHGGTEPGWKLADLRTLDDTGDANEWFESPSEANDAALSQPAAAPQTQSTSNGHAPHGSEQGEEEDDNDDYWAQYDQTPSRTPALKRSPAPVPSSTLAMTSGSRPRTESEADYFARYGSEVQPALDSHDPDEDHGELGNSTLNGDSLVRGQETSSNEISQQANYLSSLQPHSGWSQNATTDPAPPQLETTRTNDTSISQPRAVSPTASIGSVDRLEQQAEAMSSSDDRALVAIKQHISTDIKSLFRLARNAGMEREEFERVIRTELDVLGFMEDGE